jgi:DNA end-binding protein Ku
MAADFDQDLYSDDYREALQAVIDAKVGGREIVAPVEATPKPTAAVDLMAALKASVDRARAARGEAPAAGKSAHAEPTPITSARSAKKAAASTAKAAPAPAKKAAPKKTEAAAAKKAEPAAAKKTAAKKAPAKKSTRKSA